MLKMCEVKRKESKNRGSATLELCFVMPIIICVIMALIFLFLDSVKDADIQSENYSVLYTYRGQSDERQNGVLVNGGEICGREEGTLTWDFGTYMYTPRQVRYRTEYGVCTERLRRWQFYGDVLQE